MGKIYAETHDQRHACFFPYQVCAPSIFLSSHPMFAHSCFDLETCVSYRDCASLVSPSISHSGDLWIFLLTNKAKILGQPNMFLQAGPYPCGS